MLKYYESAITFSEFPDEVALCVNIMNCPCHCPGCSEPWLQEDGGKDLTNEEISKLIKQHPGCSVFGIMGGDIDHEDVYRIATFVKENYPLKVGFYSGRSFIDYSLIPVLDAYKIGPWIMPEGDPSEWWKKSCGPLQFPFSNQLYFEIKEGVLINATQKFRRASISDLTRYIITT